MWPHAGHFDQELSNTTTGIPLASTSYNVYQSDGATPVVIYNNRTRSSTVSQPLTTSAAGNAEFWCDPQSIVISIAGGTYNSDVYPDIVDLTTLLDAVLNTQDNDFGNHVISNFLMNENIKTVGYTFVASDSGSTIQYNSSSSGTFVLPNNLPVGWNVEVIQQGTGQVVFFAPSGTTLNNANNHTKTRTQYAAVTLEVKSNSGTNAAYNLQGDTSA
jgi:hypothetical protein